MLIGLRGSPFPQVHFYHHATESQFNLHLLIQTTNLTSTSQEITENRLMIVSGEEVWGTG